MAVALFCLSLCFLAAITLFYYMIITTIHCPNSGDNQQELKPLSQNKWSAFLSCLSQVFCYNNRKFGNKQLAFIIKGFLCSLSFTSHYPSYRQKIAFVCFIIFFSFTFILGRKRSPVSLLTCDEQTTLQNLKSEK